MAQMTSIPVYGHGPIKPTANRPDSRSPEGFVNQRASMMRKQIQNEFQTEWKSLSGRLSKSGIGQNKAKYLLNELHEKYRGRAAKLNQDIEQKLAEFGQMDQLASAGLIPDAGEIKWRQVLSSRAADAMFPDPEDPIKQFGKLDVHRNRIEARIRDFRISPAEKGRWGWGQDAPGKGTTLEVFDTTLVGKDKKGEYTGDWRKATLNETQEYGALTKEQKRVTAAQRPMMSSIMSTAVNSSRIGGSIQDQAKKYIENKQTQQEPEDFGTMSVEELRRITEGR